MKALRSVIIQLLVIFSLSQLILAIDPDLPDIIKGSEFIDSVLVPVIPPVVSYPAKGREAQLRCVVWVRAIVGPKGKVKKAVAVKSEFTGYGFEETRNQWKWDKPPGEAVPGWGNTQ